MRIRSWALSLALALACAGTAHAADGAIGQVKTAKGASVGITFTDSSMMSLGPNSKLALTQYRFDATTHVGVFDSVLSQGTLAAKSGQIVKQTPEAMHVSTPTALLGVRGTEFVVNAGGAK